MAEADSAGENADAPDAPVYVNHCTVTTDLSDAKLVFSQAGDGHETPNVKAKLVTSPTHLKRFRNAIADACLEHDRKFVGQPSTQSKGGGD